MSSFLEAGIPVADPKDAQREALVMYSIICEAIPVQLSA
jgi:hypothetical protein